MCNALMLTKNLTQTERALNPQNRRSQPPSLLFAIRNKVIDCEIVCSPLHQLAGFLTGNEISQIRGGSCEGVCSVD